MIASSFIIGRIRIWGPLRHAVRPPTLVASALKTIHSADPRDQTALRSVNVDALKANPLVAIEAKSDHLEGKDIVGLVAVSESN